MKIYLCLSTVILVLILQSDVGAFTHGKFVTPSGDVLVTNVSDSPPLDPLTTDGGDPLVTP